MSEKIVLVDGHSIVNRAFYGVPPLTNSKGLHTNAIYGFLNILFKVLDEESPAYLMVAFDLKAPTFRHKIYDAYKGTRKGMPDELREQVPVLKELLQAMNISIMSKEGYEADDILGTMARRAEKEGLEVCILSGDRDLLQLATKKTKIKMPHTKGGKTEVDDFYEADVIEKYQVSPAGIIELKALMGDSSDNIPGLPKVGEKTATELVKTYGTIENLKLHREEITKKALKTTLMEQFELAELSKVLATIDTDADIPFTIEEGKIADFYTKDAYAMVKELGFKNILGRFDESARNEASNLEVVELKDFAKVDALFTELMECEGTVGYSLVFSDEQLMGVVFSFEDEKAYYIPVEGFVSEGYLTDKISEILSSGKGQYVTFNVKKQMKYLLSDSGKVSHRNNLHDILILSYLLNPLKSDYDIEDIAQEQLGLLIDSKKQSFDKLTMIQAYAEASDKFLRYVGSISDVSRRSLSILLEKIKEAQMLDLYLDIEMPLTFVLVDMENEGVLVRPDELREYGEELFSRIQELEKSIYEQAGETFNINSPKQLGEILFEKMKLQGGKKTKTGYSTAADVLEKLAADNPMVADILEYRGLAKLKSTYADGLAGYIGADNRIHTTFHQTITATGRLSSADPNLQNIPIRTEIGRQLRRIFVPKDGCVFVDADYSQIELRILACMSGDERLIEAYSKEQDIHRITASQVFHVPFDQVTPLMRRNAKAVNFGVVYGISSFGLSQDLSISRKEAQEYIQNYFETYPDVKSFLDAQIEQAKADGFVTTMFNRRRPVPEMASSNFMQRQFGERVAMNAPVQGTAADIMKIAMINVYNALKEANLKSKLLLQVHDELLIEAYEEEKDQVVEILSREMMGAAKLPVSLEIDVQTGNNWYEAH